MGGLTLENAEQYEKLGSNQTYGETLANVLELAEPAKAHARQAYALMTDPKARQQFATNLSRPLNQQDVDRAIGVFSNFGPSNLTLAGAPLLAGMTAYHGTPHMFEPHPENPLGKFSLEKIGTGEGAQAYGHGIYVAENPDVAGTYRQALGSNTYLKPDKTIVSSGDAWQSAQKAVLDSKEVAGHKLHPDQASQIVEHVQEWVDKGNKAETFLQKHKIYPLLYPAYSAAVQEFKGLKPNKGALYHVDVPDEHVEKMMDWDKPLGKQSPHIKKSLELLKKQLTKEDLENLGGDINLLFGKDVKPDQFLNTWEALRGKTGVGEVLLRETGVPGMKYFDNTSRGKGEGTRNLVLFDPDIAKIIKRE